MHPKRTAWGIRAGTGVRLTRMWNAGESYGADTPGAYVSRPPCLGGSHAATGIPRKSIPKLRMIRHCSVKICAGATRRWGGGSTAHGRAHRRRDTRACRVPDSSGGSGEVPVAVVCVLCQCTVSRAQSRVGAEEGGEGLNGGGGVGQRQQPDGMSHRVSALLPDNFWRQPNLT